MNIKEAIEVRNQLDLKIANGDTLTNDDARLILELVLDTLVEVGNGITDEQLHKSADYLFSFRDKWFIPHLLL